MALLRHTYTWRCCISFRNIRVKSKGGQFRHLQNNPKLIGYHRNVPWATANLYQLNNLLTYVYQCWKVGEDGSITCWDIQCRGYVDFCRLVRKRCSYYPRNLWGYLTKFAYDIATLFPLNISESKLPHSYPFRNAIQPNKGYFANLPKLGCHINVPRGIGRRGPNRSSTNKHLPFGEKKSLKWAQWIQR